MKLTGKLTKESKSLNAALSARAGGGRVQDVTYNNESVVNENGIAIIPPYPTVPVKDVRYNNQSVVNENGVAIIPPYPTVLVKDVIYNNQSVVNENGVAVIPNQNIDYSTTEQNTGVKWIDNRPVYQKVFEYNITNTVGDGETNLFNFPNVLPISLEGFILHKTEGRMYPLPYDYGKPSCLIYTNDGNIQLRISGGDSWGVNYKIYVIMKYVKNS